MRLSLRVLWANRTSSSSGRLMPIVRVHSSSSMTRQPQERRSTHVFRSSISKSVIFGLSLPTLHGHNFDLMSEQFFPSTGQGSRICKDDSSTAPQRNSKSGGRFAPDVMARRTHKYREGAQTASGGKFHVISVRLRELANRFPCYRASQPIANSYRRQKSETPHWNVR